MFSFKVFGASTVMAIGVAGFCLADSGVPAHGGFSHGGGVHHPGVHHPGGFHPGGGHHYHGYGPHYRQHYHAGGYYVRPFYRDPVITFAVPDGYEEVRLVEYGGSVYRNNWDGTMTLVR